MPIDYSRYPPDWPEIRERILERAGHVCEWCGAPDRWYRVTWPDGTEELEPVEDGDPAAMVLAAMAGAVRITLIVLTTAHLGVPLPDGTPGDPHDKMDVRDENLAALCQRCHLNHDRGEHLRTRGRNRTRRRIAGGQLALPLDADHLAAS